MFCTKCGSELSAAEKLCAKCGSEIAVPPSIAKTGSMAENPQDMAATFPPSNLSSQSKTVSGKLALVASILFLALSYLIFIPLWVHQEGNLATALGYGVGTAIIPIVAVLIYYKRKKSNASTARILTVLASFILLANLISIDRHPPLRLTEKDIPIIAKEAAGLSPLTAPENQARAIIRDCFKEVIALNKDYMAKIGKLDLSGLYTQKSYLTPAETRHVLAELDTGINLEAGQEAGLDEILTGFKKRFAAMDMPENERADLMKGIEEKYRAAIALRKPMVDSEREWLSTVRDFYVFVQQNQRHFRPAKEKISISDRKTLNEFNQRIRRINELKGKFDLVAKDFNQVQQKNMNVLGMTAGDLGITRQ